MSRALASLALVEPRVAVGELVRTNANSYPYYQIIALADDRAWIRDVQNGADHVVPIERCRKAEEGER